MCGIFGFVGANARPSDLVVGGLRRLEYRGYDSWGVACSPLDARSPKVRVLKSVGKISRTVDEELLPVSSPSPAAIGHTRWATHGAPNEINAHPHLSRDGRLALVHNGIIENYRELRCHLERLGYAFLSDTDTETIVHLLDHNLEQSTSFTEGFAKTLRELRGAFGLAVLDAKQPNRLFAARMGSPLVVGLSEGRQYLSSDANALVSH